MKYLLMFVLFSSWKLIRNEETSIEGLVLSEKNQSTWSLNNNNLVIIIKSDTSHNNIHHLKLKVDQASFPFQFHLTNIQKIKNTSIYLLSLLIFGYTHRLLWEGTLFHQHLIINRSNSITFTVNDVSNLPKCLSEGYPCVQTNDMIDHLISTCCSYTKCEPFTSDYFICEGQTPVIQNISVSYDLPSSLLPVLGLLDQHFLEVTEKIYQSISTPGTIIKIINATIFSESNDTNENFDERSSTKYILKIHLTISSSQSCQQCQTATLHSIESESMPFNIPLEDGSSIIIEMSKPVSEISDTSNISTTTSTGTTTTTTDNPCSSTCAAGKVCVRGKCASVGKFGITLTWSRPGDGDIVLTTPNDNAIYVDNVGPSADTDQGLLDMDDRNGTGPENIYWLSSGLNPPTGAYHVCFDPFEFEPVPSVEGPVYATITVRRPTGAPSIFTKAFKREYESNSQCSPSSKEHVGSFTYP